MNGRRTFELRWVEVEHPSSLGEMHAEDLPARLREPFLLAVAVRHAGTSVVPPERDAVWLALERSLDSDVSSARRIPVRRHVTLPRRPVVVRTLVALAATFVALAAISMKAVPGSPLYQLRRGIEATALILSPNDGGLHLRLASARLDDLVNALEQGPVDEATGLARSLVAERTAAVQAGVDVSELDRGISSEVPPALAKAPAEVVAEVEATLGSLLPPDVVGQLPGSDVSGGATSGGVGGQGGSSGGGGGSSEPGGSGSTQGSDTGDSGDGSSQDSGDPNSSGGDSQGSGDSRGSGDSTGSGDSADSSDSTGSGSDSPSPDPSPEPSPTCDPDPCGGD